MKKQILTKIYYKPSEIIQLGYPCNRTMELARKIGRKANPDAERGFHYLLTLEEVKQHFGY